MVLLMKRSLKGSNEKSTCVELLVELSKCKSEKHSIDLKLILIFHSLIEYFHLTFIHICRMYQQSHFVLFKEAVQ